MQLVFLPYADSDIYAELRSLREKHASKSTLEAAEFRGEEDRLAFRDREDEDIAAEKHLYDVNARVWGLQRGLSQTAQDSELGEPVEITDKQASINGSEHEYRVSPRQEKTTSPPPAVNDLAPEDDDFNNASDAERNSDEDDKTSGSIFPF